MSTIIKKNIIEVLNDVVLKSENSQEFYNIAKTAIIDFKKNKKNDYYENHKKIWYQSIKDGQPNYQIYSQDYYLIDALLSFYLCSKKYINNVIKINAIDPYFNGIIVDVGCGLGLSTLMLKEYFPYAEVIGTNVKGKQWNYAKAIGVMLVENYHEIDSTKEIVVFASEYFEHFINPFEELKKILTLSPFLLIIANAFGANAVGHFPFYTSGNGDQISNKTIGRKFNNLLRSLYFKQVTTSFWNNRPYIWELREKETHNTPKNKGTKKMMTNFCIFILSHGRAHTMTTYRALKRQGYTGEIYILIDNEDETSQEYYNIFGKKVLCFDKKAMAKTVDSMDIPKNRQAIVYARNACYEKAKELNIDYFLQLDDDYNIFDYKIMEGPQFFAARIKDLNSMFSHVVDFFSSIPALIIAFAQGGDFIGGGKNGFQDSLTSRRKVMNTFFCKTNCPVKFAGTMNEDVTTYTTQGSRGVLFLTLDRIAIKQQQSQSLTGGMTEAYTDAGTYVKSFYSVMSHPSGVKISQLNSTHHRIHHRISWKNTVPSIIREEYKK